MTILYTILCLVALGLIFSVILYFVSKAFRVEEDPRIDQVEAALPGANCGGCGNAGCRAFAEKAVKSDNLDSLFCPVGGNGTMKNIASILGRSVTEREPLVAVVRCKGGCDKSPLTNIYDGSSCRSAAMLYSGPKDCSFGCLGLGDCAAVCMNHGISIDPATGLASINADICVGCGECVRTCPRGIIELRPKNRDVYVACMNRDKGAAVRKSCSVGCIGCGKCARFCPNQAVTIENNLAYIDYTKCYRCRLCEADCPTGAISSNGFSPAFEKEFNREKTEIINKESQS